MSIDYCKIEQSLLEFSAFKLDTLSLDKIKESEGIQTLYPFQNTAQALSTKYIAILVKNKKKIIDIQYFKLADLEKRFVSLEKKYENDKNKVSLIIYLFEKAGKCRNFRSKLQFYILNQQVHNIAKYWKFLLALTTIITSFFLFYTYLGLSEYGIPINKLTNIAEVSFVLYLLLFGIVFAVALLVALIVFLLLFFINVILDLVSCHKTTYRDAIIFSLIAWSIILLYFSILYGQEMLTSIASSIMPSKFQDKSGYRIIMPIYNSVYSGYPKLVKTVNGKQYYMVLDDNKYFYGYDINNTRQKFIKNHTASIVKLKQQLCKDYDYTEERYEKNVKNYILYNPYIKPSTQNILLKKSDSNITISSFDEKDILSKRELDKICKSIEDK